MPTALGAGKIQGGPSHQLWCDSWDARSFAAPAGAARPQTQKLACACAEPKLWQRHHGAKTLRRTGAIAACNGTKVSLLLRARALMRTTARLEAARSGRLELCRRGRHSLVLWRQVHVFVRVARRQREAVHRLAKAHDHLVRGDLCALYSHDGLDNRVCNLLAHCSLERNDRESARGVVDTSSITRTGRGGGYRSGA